MVFSSSIFMLAFLPLFLAIYYATPNAKRSWVILFGSYIFYGWWRVDFLLLFIWTTIFSYVVSKRIVNNSENAKRYMWLGVIGNLTTLAYFKYFNFGVENFNELMLAMGGQTWQGWQVILPIGISFYIFQAVSYVVDVYRGDAKPAKRLLDFAAFIALFPQLIAGPVIRYKDIEHQFRSRTHTREKFNEGALRFAVGFCKKVLIADSLAPLADSMFALENPTGAESWLGVLAYAAQLYFDFSGYSDMAIGLGLMMGFRFIENFNLPYISCSITEFWKRWHISLSTWLRDYLYIPLGGNREGEMRTYRNLMITMVLGGFWHGAAWGFVVWGLLHGGVMVLERIAKNHVVLRVPKLLKWLFTFTIVLVGWVFFRSESLPHAFAMLAAMFSPHNFGISNEVAWHITGLMQAAMVMAYGLIFIAPVWLKRFEWQQFSPSWVVQLRLRGQLIVCGLFMLAMCKMFAQSYSPFLYFQF